MVVGPRVGLVVVTMACGGREARSDVWAWPGCRVGADWLSAGTRRKEVSSERAQVRQAAVGAVGGWNSDAGEAEICVGCKSGMED